MSRSLIRKSARAGAAPASSSSANAAAGSPGHRRAFGTFIRRTRHYKHGGPRRAPHTPGRSGRPGEPGAPLDRLATADPRPGCDSETARPGVRATASAGSPDTVAERAPARAQEAQVLEEAVRARRRVVGDERLLRRRPREHLRADRRMLVVEGVGDAERVGRHDLDPAAAAAGADRMRDADRALTR